MLHDIGKLFVPVEVLDKPSKLTDQEWQLMRAASGQGGRISARPSRRSTVGGD